MKLKALGLVLVAISAFGVLGSPGTASAEICTGTTPGCTPFATGDTFTATLAGNAVFKGVVNVTCTASTIKGEAGSGTTGSITAASWTGCEPSNCTATAENLPWGYTVSPTKGTMSGTLTISNPKITLTCGGFTHCTFTAASMVLDFSQGAGGAGNEARITASKEPLTSGCGADELTANYLITTATMVSGGTVASPAIYLPG